MAFWDPWEDLKYIGGKIGEGAEWAWNKGPGGSLDYFSGKQGLAHAAAGAKDVSDQTLAFSKEQWERMMQGLAGAQGAMTPAQNQFNNTYGQQGPSNSQNFFNQSQASFGTPSAQSKTFQNFSNWANDPANNATQHGATKASQFMTGPTASSTAHKEMGGVLQGYNAPDAGKRQFANSQPTYNQAGAGESWYDQNRPKLDARTGAEIAYGTASGQLGTPGRSEQFQVQAPTNLHQGNDARQSWANGPGLGEQNVAENKGFIRGASQAGDYFASQRGALEGPGAYENFVSQDISGTNPELDRARRKSAANINQDMARRGHFDSGGAAIALGESEGAFQAADYQNRAQRAQTAQQMQMGRIGTGGSLAGQAAGTDISRGTALHGIDMGNEAAQLARREFGLRADQATSGEGLAGQQLGLQAAGQADSSQLARLQSLSGIGAQADNSSLQRLQLGQNAANDAQSQQLNRLRDAQAGANSVDSTQLAGDDMALKRMLASFNMAQGADDSNQTRANALFDQGQKIDQAALERFKMMGDQASSLDNNDLARLLGQGGLAKNADEMEQQRMRDAFLAQLGISKENAGLYSDFFGKGGALSGSAFSDGMNALANSYGLAGKAKNATSDFLMQLATRQLGSG